eukprot:1159644-Pelagomonas_calceolata.AAC.4
MKGRMKCGAMTTSRAVLAHPLFPNYFFGDDISLACNIFLTETEHVDTGVLLPSKQVTIPSWKFRIYKREAISRNARLLAAEGYRKKKASSQNG